MWKVEETVKSRQDTAGIRKNEETTIVWGNHHSDIDAISAVAMILSQAKESDRWYETLSIHITKAE